MEDRNQFKSPKFAKLCLNKSCKTMYKLLQRQIIKTLKITLQGILLQSIFVSLLIANDSNAQRQRSIEEIYINVNFENATLKEVLNEISSKSNLNFSYERNNIPLKNRITAQANHESVANILRDISKSANVKFKRVNGNIFVATLKNEKIAIEEEFLQDVEVSGQIVDETGQGLPGASIIIKGTSSGTTSDLDGNFKFSAPEDAILVVSFVGYKSQEIILNGRSKVDVALEVDAETLSEVVVVGYGTQKKSEVTSSISQINGKDFENSTASNVAMALQGRASGVEMINSGTPGSTPSIRIRGVGTINNSEPLIVLDGVPVSSDVLAQLASSEIQSVEILKDAASGAIYGTRAANGVVLITTNRSRLNEDTRVQLSASTGYNSVIKKYEVTSAEELYELKRER